MLAAEPARIATDVLDRLERAWNQGDGLAFGAVYAPEATFVTIRGEHLAGADVIGQGHQGIFTSIYAGSVNRMRLIQATELASGVVLAFSENTLQCPKGPLVGTHRAMSTNVLTWRPDDHRRWHVIATHNTLERI